MTNEVSVPAKPTRLLVEKNTKDEIIKGRVEEVTLLYPQLQEGELAFGSETDRNLTVQMAVTKDTAHNWKATFPKNGYREVSNEQFTKSFKIDPPYPEQGEQYVLKLKSRATYQHDNEERDIKAGDLVPYDSPSRPKLYEIVNGTPVDITMTTQPANGSKGIVAFRATTNKFGTFPVLSGVLVTDLIELEQQSSIASDFGITADTPSTQRRALEDHSNGDDTNSGDGVGSSTQQQDVVQTDESGAFNFDDNDW